MPVPNKNPMMLLFFTFSFTLQGVSLPVTDIEDGRPLIKTEQLSVSV